MDTSSHFLAGAGAGAGGTAAHTSSLHTLRLGGPLAVGLRDRGSTVTHHHVQPTLLIPSESRGYSEGMPSCHKPGTILRFGFGKVGVGESDLEPK